MSGLFAFLMIPAMLAVVGALFLGLFTMARGRPSDPRTANRLMRWRVVLQGIALALLALALLTAR